MPRTRRIVLFGVIGLVGVVVLAAAALYLLLDTNAYKARLESTASRALGMEVEVTGRLAIDFFPGLAATLEDVYVRSRGGDVVSAKQATIGIDLLSVFGNNVRIEKIVLKNPTIVIERDRDGRFNFETGRAGGESLPALDWPDVSLSDATIAYVDHRFGKGFEARDCSAEVRRLRHAAGQRANLIRDISFTAGLRCAEVRKDGFTAADLTFTADAKNGILELKPLTTRVFGTPGSGSVHADLAGPVPTYQIVYSLAQFPIEKFFEATSMKQMAAGRMDFSAHLSTHGKSAKDMRQAMKGTLSLRGKGLVFKGGDLDREFARFESSQTFDLLDVGAVFFVGPLGLLVTKGYDFATIAKGGQGSSEIRTIVSDWKVEGGVARAQDVAMATNENRIALQGGLDFVNERFDDVTIALVDAKGCVTVRQRIRGSFREPVMEKPNLLQSLAGPALRLLRKGGDLLGGQQCEVFYAGSVAAPK